MLNVAALAQSMQFAPVTPMPVRLLDAHSGGVAIIGRQFIGSSPITHQSLDILVVECSKLPSIGVGAAVRSTARSTPAAASLVSAWPTGGIRPSASNLNLVSEQTISNQAIAEVTANSRDFVHFFAGASPGAGLSRILIGSKRG